MLKRKKTLSKLLATTMVLTSFTVNASAAEVNTSTIGGNDRYETAIKISENGWTSSDRAVLINGEKGLVDALTATPYAYAKNAPILITGQGKLTTSTKNRLSAMNVKNVDIVGGVNSVSNQVVNELKNMGITANRISGASRYDTSLAVAKEVDKIQDVSEIAVVNGDKGIPDAVSVAAPAASKKMPILLAENGGLNSVSKDFVNGESVSKSYVIGSSNSVSDSVMNSLPGTKTRLGGADRHDTNAAVIKEFYTASSLSNVYVAKSGYVKNNDEIVDALAAGVLAAKNGNPVVLVGNSINSSQQTLLAGKKFTKLTQIGMGVPANSVNQIKATQADEESAVNSVSVVDYKTIKVTGKLLDKLSASSFSVSGNSVSSYTPNTAGTEATIAFNNAFASSNTLSVTSNLGKVTTHTFTYNTNISSVQASTKEVGKSGLQYLELTVNGSEKRSVKQLNEQGWKVEFTSNEAVFYGGNSTSTDGKLITDFNNSEFKTFNYQVKLTKGNTVIPSEKGYVDIVDKKSQFSSIDSFDISTNNIVVSSKTVVIGEKINLTNFKATNKDGSKAEYGTLKNNQNIDVKSSNIGVISAKLDGATDKNELTAVSAGKSTITVTDGNVSKDIVLEVKEGQREAKTVTANPTTLYIATKNGETTTNVIVKDQFGDPYFGDTNFKVDDKLETTGSTPIEIATVAVGTEASKKTNAKGELALKITPDSVNTGNAPLYIKTSDGTTKLATINVYIANVTTSKSYKFENVDKKADTTLDVYDDNDNSVYYNINEYSDNYLIGEVSLNDINTAVVDNTSGKYSVISSDTKIATVTKDDVKLKISAIKKGNVDLKVYKSGKLDYTVRLTIKDSTPTISNIDFKNVDTIKDVNPTYNAVTATLDLTKFSDEKTVLGGVTISGKGGDVEYSAADGKLRIFKLDSNGELTKDSTNVGSVKVTTNFNTGIVTGNEVALNKGAKGTITVAVYTKRSTDGEIDLNSSPLIKTIEVNIPQ